MPIVNQVTLALIPLEGVLDWITKKNVQTQSVLMAVAITIGIIFVIWQALLSRGAMARIIIAALAAGIFVWAVWNITSLKNMVGGEFTASISLTPVHASSAPLTPGPDTPTWA